MRLSEDLKFVTSPFFVFEFNNSKIVARNLHTNSAFKKVSSRLVDISHFCLTPKLRGELLQHGFSEREIVCALSSGIICDTCSDEYVSAELWEKHNWTRAAYLAFSQLNLKYVEEDPDEVSIPSLFELRRQIVREQQQEGKYPEYITFIGDFIQLEEPHSPKENRIDSIFKRKSVRSFKKEIVSISCFSSVIHDATEQIRALHVSRSQPDPLQMFNSFYSWAVVFIAIQGVEGIDNGIYHYDPVRHGLTRVNSYKNERDIYSCIQYQRWIKGGGFCLFLCSQWDRYYWIYRHSRAYINLLIQAGELGQEFFQAASNFGLGGWGTPAIHETSAKKLLNLVGIPLDPLYFIKIGVPKDDSK